MRLALILQTTILCVLSGCQFYSHEARYHLEGQVHHSSPMAYAEVQVTDSQGKQLRTQTDHQGIYRIELRGFRPPLIISAIEAGDNRNCRYHQTLRARCLASILPVWQDAPTQQANINPLTDRIVSDIAVSLGFRGPQQFVEADKVPSIPTEYLVQARARALSGFVAALQTLHIENTEQFDPVSAPFVTQKQLLPVFQVLHHNRNYHNDTGETGHTVLTDIRFRPIVGLRGDGAYEPLNLSRALNEKHALQHVKNRIFIVGDSTAATYEQLRWPRMGWGQVFHEFFREDAEVWVVNGARAGRSSRDFYHGGWYRQMADHIQPGDYIFIHHGHNDQNCNSAKPIRGNADVANLCTYPNHAETGAPQHPEGQPELSFQHSLERYIQLARKAGAHPVLLTPTARVLTAEGQKGLPAIHSHLTRQNTEQGYQFIGDYSDTVRITARKNQVPLLAISEASLALANQLGEPGWRSHWLVVDPTINTFYANDAPGSLTNPDTTHFQERGARAIAQLVTDQIKAHPELNILASKLK